MEVKDEDEAIPLHDACAGGKVGHGPYHFFCYSISRHGQSLWLIVLFLVEIELAGYLEIVELLFSRASGPECVKRMIDTIDIEGDTVSILHILK